MQNSYQLMALADALEKRAGALDNVANWIAENPEWATAILGGAVGGGMGALNPHPGGGLSLGNIILGLLLGGGLGYGAGYLGRDKIRDWFTDKQKPEPELNPDDAPAGPPPEAKSNPAADTSSNVAPEQTGEYPDNGELPARVTNETSPTVASDPETYAPPPMPAHPPGTFDPSGSDADVNNAIPAQEKAYPTSNNPIQIHLNTESGITQQAPAQNFTSIETTFPQQEQGGLPGSQISSSDLTSSLDPSGGNLNVESPVDRLWLVPPSGKNVPANKGEIPTPRAVNRNAERKTNILPGAKNRRQPAKAHPVNSVPDEQLFPSDKPRKGPVIDDRNWMERNLPLTTKTLKYSANKAAEHTEDTLNFLLGPVTGGISLGRPFEPLKAPLPHIDPVDGSYIGVPESIPASSVRLPQPTTNEALRQGIELVRQAQRYALD